MRAVRFLTSIVIIIACSGAAFAAAAVTTIDFEYPSFAGDFYVSGTVFMPPGAVLAEDNIVVKTLDGKEEATFIKVLR